MTKFAAFSSSLLAMALLSSLLLSHLTVAKTVKSVVHPEIDEDFNDLLAYKRNNAFKIDHSSNDLLGLMIKRGEIDQEIKELEDIKSESQLVKKIREMMVNKQNQRLRKAKASAADDEVVLKTRVLPCEEEEINDPMIAC